MQNSTNKKLIYTQKAIKICNDNQYTYFTKVKTSSKRDALSAACSLV